MFLLSSLPVRNENSERDCVDKTLGKASWLVDTVLKDLLEDEKDEIDRRNETHKVQNTDFYEDFIRHLFAHVVTNISYAREKRVNRPSLLKNFQL